MKSTGFKTALVCLGMLLLTFSMNAQKGGKLKMWYDKPAMNWNEALPVGNGRIACMVYGDPANEKLQLNESSFWSGGPSRNDNPNGLIGLDSIRQALFSENYRLANNLSNKYLTAKKLHGSKFLNVGELNMTFEGNSSVTEYYRELDLEKALFTTTFVKDGVTFKREVFASQPDQVIVVRLSASKPGMISFTANLDGGQLQKTSKALNSNTLEMTSLSSTHEGVTGQVKQTTQAKFMNVGGSLTSTDKTIGVSKANEVLVFVSIATNFVDYKTLTANETEKCANYLTPALAKPYPVLLKNHTTAYQKYFKRVSFDLGTSEAAKQPTNIRIQNFSKSNDPELVSMYYQFGRYLLICSSQPGGQAANLQGIWNGSNNPAWDSKYTININTEMNYWPSEKCNLTEMSEPLMSMIKDLSESGKETAKVMYGSDGWVAHHNTDIWRITGVVDFADAGQWPMGGAWLAQHLWEKYIYGGDTKFLETAYPILKSACEFYQDFLVEEPTHKWLVVSPSNSPEIAPPNHGSALVYGATMDNQLLFDLFSKTIKAAKILNKDPELMLAFQKILDRIAPMQIGRLGQLQEWMGDWDDPKDKNRHVSHLYGMYPGNQISAYTSPALFDAVKTSLNFRGDVSTGWSMGWKVNLWARLLDGNHARKLISDQLTLVDPTRGNSMMGGGGTYPNFFDAHPPFQIDGNFGCTSGITEMLLQSQDGSIHLLPALPDDWKKGSISGLKAYGGFEVSIVWDDAKVQQIVVKSNLGGNCRLRVPNTLTMKGKALTPAKGENPNTFFAVSKIKEPIVSPNAKLNKVELKSTLVYDIPTKAGKTYIFEIKK